jgi:hypothetical protein
VWDADDFAVGDVVTLVWSADAPGVMYPRYPGLFQTVEDYWYAIVLLGGPGLLLQGAWLVRFLAWRRAAAAPGRRFRASLLLGFGHGRAMAVPWLRLATPGEPDRLQPVMWEPWLRELTDTTGIAVVAHRSRPGGPLVVDVPGRGRLWPAGRARARQPVLVDLGAGRFDTAPVRRWPWMALLCAPFGLVVAVLVDPVTGVGAVALVVSAYLFYGGAPRVSGGRRPRPGRAARGGTGAGRTTPWRRRAVSRGPTASP